MVKPPFGEDVVFPTTLSKSRYQLAKIDSVLSHDFTGLCYISVVFYVFLRLLKLSCEIKWHANSQIDVAIQFPESLLYFPLKITTEN